jgi:hypothetical protein
MAPLFIRNILDLIEAENVESGAPKPGADAGVHAYPTGILRESPVAYTMIAVFYASMAADRGGVNSAVCVVSLVMYQEISSR